MKRPRNLSYHIMCRARPGVPGSLARRTLVGGRLSKRRSVEAGGPSWSPCKVHAPLRRPARHGWTDSDSRTDRRSPGMQIAVLLSAAFKIARRPRRLVRRSWCAAQANQEATSTGRPASQIATCPWVHSINIFQQGPQERIHSKFANEKKQLRQASFSFLAEWWASASFSGGTRGSYA